ncbi:MAG: serine hydrolase domain-containing protein, partial [Planctomycetota bacterium]
MDTTHAREARMPRLISLALIALVLLAPNGLAQGELRFDTPLEEGSAFGYRVAGDASFEVLAPFLPGGGQSETFEHTIELELRVVRADEDGALIEARVLEIGVSSSSSLEGAGVFPMGADDEPSPISERYREAFAGAIDAVYTLVVDNTRTITAVRAPAGARTGMSRDVRNAYERVLGADRLREALQPVLRPPGAPDAIRVGDEWAHASDERTALGRLTFTSVHRLDHVDDASAACTLVGSIAIDTDGLGRRLTVERDEHTGALEWDVAAGVARSVRSDVDLRYSLSETPPIRASVASSDRIERTERPTERTDAPDVDDLSEMLRSACARFDQPAMAAAVVSPDATLAIGVAGTRINGVDNPVTPDDRWHIGSCTKAITATLLMRALNDAPNLSLTSTLADAFPEHAQTMHPRYRAATIADVLAHAAGLPALTNGMSPDRAALVGLPDTPRGARAAFTERLLTAADGLPYAPVNGRSAYVYSNASFGVAAALTEKLLGTPWEEALARDVFRPLGMDRAGVGWPAEISAMGEPR